MKPTPDSLEGPPDQEFTLHWSDKKLSGLERLMTFLMVLVLLTAFCFVVFPLLMLFSFVVGLVFIIAITLFPNEEQSHAIQESRRQTTPPGVQIQD